ncbi:MAG: bifunctional methylenetetrahydrofolate dehydrogenase/methenyltetrahydrofolate cyclohydrolase FolD [Clostridiaceae bacterium]|nr:bifunctional methylenetetrahydrofolate dehydrogenase/methenyltetrahydrofolate cyclohydrolase FolD [Clostridiaceae bacterium]
MSTLIDGKALAAKMRAQMGEEVENLVKETGKRPGLAVILVGADPASQIYVRNKEKACESVGILSTAHRLSAETSEEELLKLIDRLNEDPEIHGILCQLPVPDHICTDNILQRISPQKDVDGFHPINVGNLVLGKECLMPCTPAGVMEMLNAYNIDPEGQHCVIVGRSTLVGKPLIQMMLNKNATVTVTHSRTRDLASICCQGDILVAAVGVPELIGRDHIKQGAVVIDVGINRREDGKLIGDVDGVAAAEVASYYTPVAGGVGPMTITMLLKNTIRAYKNAYGV